MYLSSRYYKYMYTVVRNISFILQVIPMVSIKLHSLEQTENDYGVIGWQAILKEKILGRLGNVEFLDSYSVATLVDPRLILNPPLYYS